MCNSFTVIVKINFREILSYLKWRKEVFILWTVETLPTIMKFSFKFFRGDSSLTKLWKPDILWKTISEKEENRCFNINLQYLQGKWFLLQICQLFLLAFKLSFSVPLLDLEFSKYLVLIFLKSWITDYFTIPLFAVGSIQSSVKVNK